MKLAAVRRGEVCVCVCVCVCVSVLNVRCVYVHERDRSLHTTLLAQLHSRCARGDEAREGVAHTHVRGSEPRVGVELEQIADLDYISP